MYIVTVSVSVEEAVAVLEHLVGMNLDQYAVNKDVMVDSHVIGGCRVRTWVRRWAINSQGTVSTTIEVQQGGRWVRVPGATSNIKRSERTMPQRHLEKVEKILAGVIE